MIQLALIGVGSWGKNYISTVNNLSNVAIKYLCATSDNHLSNFQGDFIKVRDYKELFKFSDIDGVIIASPNASHHELTYQLLKRGFNVLVEKPMSENYLQSKKLKALVKKNGPILQVGHIYLFDPAYQKTREIVPSIGEIRYINFEGTNNGPYRKGTSALWDIGSHALSLCLDITQKKPKSISGWASILLDPVSNHYDFSSLRLEFENGLHAYIKVSWLFPKKRRELLIVGEKDSVLYDAEADRKIQIYKNMVFDKKHVFSKEAPKITYPEYSSVRPLQNELATFVSAIKERKYVAYSGIDLGLQVTKLLNLAERSIASNGKPMIYK